ncbi:hypothetical protein JVU11DRAFT_479 [Chiua virens]|nr:hypothetical protein JVU11DRAFT_479 [Chiua virens]
MGMVPSPRNASSRRGEVCQSPNRGYKKALMLIFCGCLVLLECSYIEDFWNDPTPDLGAQLPCAALIISSLGFIHNLRARLLDPDAVRGHAFDMDQYMTLFRTPRIPTQVRTSVAINHKKGDARWSQLRLLTTLSSGEDSSVLLACRSLSGVISNTLVCLDWFDVLDDENRPLLTECEVLKNLQAIVQDADKMPITEVHQPTHYFLSFSTMTRSCTPLLECSVLKIERPGLGYVKCCQKTEPTLRA